MMALYVQNDQSFLMTVILLALIVQKILSACMLIQYFCCNFIFKCPQGISSIEANTYEP